MVSMQPANNAAQNDQPRSNNTVISRNIGNEGITNQKVARAWAAMVT